MTRIDAQRNVDALLAAAKQEFALQGVDVNVRAIAARAGVGTATLYRHFPLRSDLVSAVFRREIAACAAEAPPLVGAHEPDQALRLWLQRYTEFVATKHWTRSCPALRRPGSPRPTKLLPRATRPGASRPPRPRTTSRVSSRRHRPLGRSRCSRQPLHPRPRHERLDAGPPHGRRVHRRSPQHQPGLSNSHRRPSGSARPSGRRLMAN